MNQVLLSPPVAFLILLILGVATSYLSVSISGINKDNKRKYEPYASGQRKVEHNVVPDHSRFFPYAFSSIILFVMVLVVITATMESITMPLLYIACGILAILVIFRV